MLVVAAVGLWPMRHRDRMLSVLLPIT